MRKLVSIEWKTESSESRTEQVSPDGRWHLDTKVERDGKRQMHLSNYDLICSPMGSGVCAEDCWRNFILNCDKYAAKLAEIKEEALAALAALRQQLRIQEA